MVSVVVHFGAVVSFPDVVRGGARDDRGTASRVSVLTDFT